jgi:hypothetical protein
MIILKLTLVVSVLSILSCREREDVQCQDVGRASPGSEVKLAEQSNGSHSEHRPDLIGIAKVSGEFLIAGLRYRKLFHSDVVDKALWDVLDEQCRWSARPSSRREVRELSDFEVPLQAGATVIFCTTASLPNGVRLEYTTSNGWQEVRR